MLQELHVQNFALIDDVGVEFHEGLNILSGETGAGKSIIMGSVNIALGAKASKDYIRHGCSSAYVELTFKVDENQKVRLAELDIEADEDSMIVISKKITEQKSTSRINGETVSIGRLREAAAILIDIHGQQDNQTLTNQSKQLTLLDSFSANEDEHFSELLKEYEEKYSLYQKTLHELEGFDLDEGKRLREISYLEFVVDEIEQADLKVGEEEELLPIYKKISNSRNIEEGMSEVTRSLFNGDGEHAPALDSISEAAGALRKLTQYDEELIQLSDTLSDLENMMSDLEREIENYCEGLGDSGEEFEQVSKRLDLIHDLQYKYGKTVEEVLQYKDEQKERLEQLYDYDMNKQECMTRKEELFNSLCLIASSLHDIRVEEAQKLGDAIGIALSDLNFLNSEFKIMVNYDYGNFTPNGSDKVVFLISPNPGEPCKPIAEIASGGELSRIMLALKAVLADQDEIDAFIFDEIDAGISGRTAQKVAEKLTKIALNHQIICISHLPQIVAMADYHYLIEKVTDDNVTKTLIKQLEYEDSVTEIARLLGGAEVTQSVLDTAWELKDLAQKSKYI